MGISVLAQAENAYGSVIFWGIILIAFLVGGFILTAYIRRRLSDDGDDLSTPGGIGFSLPALRELHEQGKLTREEFEKAKFAIVQNVKAQEAAKVEAAKDKQRPLIPPPARPRQHDQDEL